SMFTDASVSANGLTYEAWFNDNGSAPGATLIGTDPSGFQFTVNGLDNGGSFPLPGTLQVNKEQYFAWPRSTGTYTQGTWNHLGVTLATDQKTITYYINGTPAGSDKHKT